MDFEEELDACIDKMTEKMMIKELRKQQTNPTFRNNVYNEKGNSCGNCGTTENLEIHHIVSLENGGSNNVGNLALLCYVCHDKAHKRAVRDYAQTGRPNLIEFSEAEKHLSRYFNVEIGMIECKKLLGMSAKTKGTWYRLVNEYKKKHKIEDFYNNIDLINSQNRRTNKCK